MIFLLDFFEVFVNLKIGGFKLGIGILNFGGKGGSCGRLELLFLVCFSNLLILIFGIGGIFVIFNVVIKFFKVNLI